MFTAWLIKVVYLCCSVLQVKLITCSRSTPFAPSLGVGFTGADKGAGEPLPIRSYLERFQHHKTWFNFAQVFSVVLEGKGVLFRDVPQCFRFFFN